MDASTMHIERHERGIHAVWFGAGGAEVSEVRFRSAKTPAATPRRPAATEDVRTRYDAAVLGAADRLSPASTHCDRASSETWSRDPNEAWQNACARDPQ
jgi:hypothetical protein